MREYSINVRWNHKGNRYPLFSNQRVKASTAEIAARKALKAVRVQNRGSFREVADAQIRIDIIVIGTDGKEGEDGRGDVLRQEAEPESGR